MKNKRCYLFVFPGFSDWEPALTAAMLQQHTNFEVLVFSVDGKPITSAANLRITPALSLAEVDPSKADLLLLPGGLAWSEDKNSAIAPLVKAVLDAGKTVAAICDAVLYLASEGHLDKIPHTSNDPGMLQEYVPSYKGAGHYIQQPAVDGGQIITANGTAGTAFAHAILKKFRLLEENKTLSFFFGFFHQPDYRYLYQEQD